MVRRKRSKYHLFLGFHSPVLRCCSIQCLLFLVELHVAQTDGSASGLPSAIACPGRLDGIVFIELETDSATRYISTGDEEEGDDDDEEEEEEEEEYEDDGEGEEAGDGDDAEANGTNGESPTLETIASAQTSQCVEQATVLRLL
jgi:hypothetical protein